MEILFYAAVFLFGLCIGSFLNVVVYRLPRGESLVRPPSHCPACGTRLGALDLVPLLGYMFLRGRCRYCGARISPRYPLVEMATGLLFTAVFSKFGLSLEAAGKLFLLVLLLAISLIDLEHLRVPNGLVLVGLAGGAIWRTLQATGRGNGAAWVEALAGLAVAGGVMLVIYLASRGGMGAGDVKLAALIGFFSGPAGAAVVLFLGFAAGALAGLFQVWRRRSGWKEALPFAPFLSLAALVEVFYGAALWQGYLKLMGW